MALLPEQREALIDALIENWPGHGDPNALDDILFYGRRGFVDYTDEQLIEDGCYWCPDRLVELGIKVEG